MTTSDEAAFPHVDVSNSTGTASPHDKETTRANAVPIQDVAAWLGLMRDGVLRCPAEIDGDERGDHYGVHLHQNGIKCPHTRCRDKGNGANRTGPRAAKEGGYRTCVALVAEVRGVDPREAVELLLAQFDPRPKVEIEQLLAFAGQQKKKSDNRAATLGVHLARLCKGQKLDAEFVQPLARILGERFHDCDAGSIARHFRQSTDTSVEDIAKVIEAAQSAKKCKEQNEETNRLGCLVVKADPAAMADKAETILASVGGFYQHGNRIARIEKSEKPAKRLQSQRAIPVLVEAPEPSVREAAGRAFWSSGEQDELGKLKRVLPPDWAIKTLVARGKWPSLPNVEGVAECPVMRRDGTIAFAPGYDEPSGVFLVPNADYPPVPDVPTRGQVDAAISEIDAVFHDVPFEAAEHRGAVFAAILSLAGRDTFDGPAPCFVAEATKPGSGKDLVVNLIVTIGTGSTPFSASFSENDAEMRKLITSIGMAGSRAVNFANVTGKFGGAALCKILTDSNWGDRVLGGNVAWSGRMPTVWFATANNPSIGADMFRRIVSIRLDWGRLGITSPEQLPSDYWHHKDVLKYALDNRPKLVVAALTILRYYFANGSPEQQTSEWGSYPAWQRVVLGALSFAGLPDPGAARESFRKRADFGSNLETQLLIGLTWLFESVGRGKPMLAAEVLDHVKARTGTLNAPREGLNFDFATKYDALGEALRGLLCDENDYATRGEPAQLPNSRQLGKLLGRLNGTLFDISPRVGPPDPPHELVTAAATAPDESVFGQQQDKRIPVGTKSPDGTMVWRDIWGEQWRRLPDGQTQMWHGGQWGSLWRLRLPHHPGATWWRISGTAGEVEMWVPETNQWIPQPRVKVRVVQVDKDSSSRGLWSVERWGK